MFFDTPGHYLSNNAQYYFNILVICIAVSPTHAQYILDKNISDIWYMQQITDSRPKVIHIFVDEMMDKDIDYLIECFPHSVVEVNQQRIYFYDMIDFDTDDPWEINPYEPD